VRVDPEVSGVRALPARVGPPLAIVSVLAAIALVVLAFVFAGESVGAAVDIGLRADLRHLDSPWPQIALVIDWTGEPVGAALVLATLVIVFLRLGNRRAAVLVVAGTATAVAVTSLMKPLVGRTINDGFLSFPSGHTATATSFALVAMLVLVNRGRTPLLLLVTVLAAAAMAWAQILLNAHYPTDTIGGFCAALTVVPLVAWTIDRVADRKSTVD
jgi:membrane-associated phospholipid phosphatase